MSLNIYRRKEEIPEGVRYIHSNDRFFNGGTLLDDSDFCKNVLKEIDDAVVKSPEYFISNRESFKGGINRENLSTGTKTLLNIYKNPEYCFNIVECGNNALEFLCDLRDGHVLWETPALQILRDDESCDIMYRGICYTNICDFMEAVL